MDEYKFDRTAFRIMTFEEAEATNKFAADISYSERLRQAYYLISRAYGFQIDNPPRLDKTIFSSRKLSG